MLSIVTDVDAVFDIIKNTIFMRLVEIIYRSRAAHLRFAPN